MEVLALLGHDGVDGPRHPIGSEYDDHGTAAAFGIGQCIEQPPEHRIEAFKRGGSFHRLEDWWRWHEAENLRMTQSRVAPLKPNNPVVNALERTVARSPAILGQTAWPRSDGRQ